MTRNVYTKTGFSWQAMKILSVGAIFWDEGYNVAAIAELDLYGGMAGWVTCNAAVLTSISRFFFGEASEIIMIG